MKLSAVVKEKRALVVLLLITLVASYYVVKPFLIPMIVAAILAIIFSPVQSYLCRKTNDKKRLSAILTTVLVLVLIILPVTWIATVVVEQLYSFIGHFDLKALFSDVFQSQVYKDIVEPAILDIERDYNIKIDLLGLLTKFGKNVASLVYNYSPSVLVGTAGFLMNFFIMLAGLYFLLVDGKNIIKLIFDISPLRETHERRLAQKIKLTLDASVYGYLVTGIVQGIVAGIFFYIVGLESFVLLGVLTFFMSMVPIVGATGVWLPVCIWLFSQGQTWQGVTILLSGALGISMIDNFIKPVVIESRTKIHPLIVFFSLFGGIQLFGPLGILFGPVVVTLCVAIINIYREETV